MEQQTTKGLVGIQQDDESNEGEFVYTKDAFTGRLSVYMKPKKYLNNQEVK